MVLLPSRSDGCGMAEDFMDRLSFFSGAAAGAALMFMLDAGGGARRRAMTRDRVQSGHRRSRDFLGKAGLDLRHRAEGAVAGVRHRLEEDEDVPDGVLEERVRAKLGRHTSHPRAIEVTASAGCVCLSGPILADEMDGVLRAVESVRGVRVVDNALEPHERSERRPELQGGFPPPGEPHEWEPRVWTPGIPLLTGTAVALGLLFGARVAASRLGGRDGEEVAPNLEEDPRFAGGLT